MIQKIKFVLVVAMLFTGCAMQRMQIAEDQKLPALDPALSRVVFMRSSLHGTVVAAGMYHIVDNKPQYIGNLNNNQKIYIDTPPGEQVFMSLGVSVRFLVGDLQPDKTYYVMATPRGWPAINFALYPIRESGEGKFHLDSAEFRDWKENTKLVVMSSSAQKWAESHKKQANGRFEVEWPLWQARPVTFKENFTIHSADGL